MKNILIITSILLLHISLQGQSKLNSTATKMMNTYWGDPTIEHLTEAEGLISKVWESESASTDAIALYLKSQLLTAQLINEAYDESEDYDVFLDDLVDTYNTALIYDNTQNRYQILKNLYAVKASLTTKGAAYYTEEDYERASGYYNAATRMNEVEIEFPRVARPDTSTIYTTAVMARLAGKDQLAMKYFERVVDLGLSRVDAYDQLIALYEKNKFDVKAKKMAIRKNKAFPPEQND